MWGSRNIIYETKKAALNRESNTHVQESDLSYKEERDNLRNLMRRKQADVIRLQSQNQSLRTKILHLESQFRTWKLQQADYRTPFHPHDSNENVTNQNSVLKGQLSNLQRDNTQLNVRKNQSEKDCRELIAENERMRRRLRELQIIEQMRRQRFEEEVKSLKPIVITTNDSDELLKDGNQLLIQTLRAGIVKIVCDVFINSASVSDKRKVNSTTIFKSNINQLKKSAERNGLVLLCKIYSSFRDLVKMVDTDYGQLDSEPRSQFNDWLEKSMLGVKILRQNPKKQQDQSLYLFRLMALHYRVRYPLKGEQSEVDRDLQTALEDLIVFGLFQLLARI